VDEFEQKNVRNYKSKFEPLEPGPTLLVKEIFEDPDW